MAALKAQRSLPWAMAASFFERFAPAVALLLMAPIIGVQQTGVASISMALIFILALPFKGFSETLTQEQQIDQKTMSALLFLAVTLSSLFCLLLWTASGAIAALYGLPQLAQLIPTHSLVILGMALGVIHDGLFQRSFQFQRQAKRKAAGGLVGLTVGFAYAFWKADATALVVYHLATVWASTVIGWAMSPIQVDIRPHLKTMHILLPKTMLLATSQFIGQINQRGIDLIVGLILGASQVAIIRLALQVFNLVTAVVVTPIATVLLPYFSELNRAAQHDPKTDGKPQADFIRTQALAVHFILPAFIYGGLAMPYAFEMLMGPDWIMAGEVGRIVSVNGVAVMFSILASTFLIAIGRLSKHFAISLLQAALTIITTAVFAGFGLMVLAWAYVARGIAATMITLRILERNGGVRRVDLLKATVGPIFCTAVGSGAFLLFENAMHTFSQPILLAGAGLCAIFGHSLVVTLFFRTEIKDAVAIIGEKWNSRTASRKK